MSKYTTELRYVCENLIPLAASTGYMGVDDVIKEALPLIFDFDFPIFDKDYKSVLCTKIIKHYYTREIGEETYGLWKLRLNTKLNEIMPYYNMLYNSGIRTFNPLWDTDMETVVRGKKDGASESEEITKEDVTRDGVSNVEGKSDTTTSFESGQSTTNELRDTETRIRNDTPQGDLNGVINLNYMTEANIDTGTHNTTNSVEENSTNNQVVESSQSGSSQDNEKRNIDRDTGTSYTDTSEYVTRVTGRQGTNLAEQIEALKSTLLNIDMMIVNDLEPLFMSIY